MDFITRLFDSSEFTPKRFAGPGWTTTLIYLDITSHVIIIIAFLSIPISLFYLKASKLDPIVKPQIYSLFYWFAIVCAITRCSSILVYFWPINRFYILLNYLCAFVVCRLAFRIKDAIEYLINLPPFSTVQNQNLRQQEELDERKIAQEKLQREVRILSDAVYNFEEILKRELWLHDRQGTINKLGEILNQLGKNSNE